MGHWSMHVEGTGIHDNENPDAAVLGKITSGCGCDMQPVYANAAA